MTNSVTHDEQLIDTMRASVIRKAIGPTILLGSGTYFDFEDPESSEITIEDIAYGLAFEGRCAGQCFSRIFKQRVYYSVAQHCILMSAAVEPPLALQALMHEVGEAVCGDMTAPLKSLNPSYKAIEKRCEAAILNRFGIVMTDPVAIKHADVRMLATERRDLLLWRGEKWSLTEIEPYDFEIIPWGPEQAAEAFLSRYYALAGIARPETTTHLQPPETVREDGTAYLVSALVEKPGQTGHRAQVGVFASKEEAIGSSLELWQTEGWSVSSYDCKLCNTVMPKPLESSNV